MSLPSPIDAKVASGSKIPAEVAEAELAENDLNGGDSTAIESLSPTSVRHVTVLRQEKFDQMSKARIALILLR